MKVTSTVYTQKTAEGKKRARKCNCPPVSALSAQLSPANTPGTGTELSRVQ